jgi:tetratricopeptide (TPR) repeat protein
VVSEWDKSNNNMVAKAAIGAVSSGGGRGGKGYNSSADKLPVQPAMPSQKVAHESAEKHKNKGNSFMANREYQQALESYTSALEFSPNGPQSHVYYSNRAAALCYLERYQEAAQDSERALGLKPNYGKAHARLGLSRYFLNDYEGAAVAYTAALRYDPDNAASKSYLAKAKQKLERQQAEAASINVNQEARRLMEDPDMLLMAKKVLSANDDAELLNDPEMKNISRRAMADPTMNEALQHIHQVDKAALSPTNNNSTSHANNSASSRGKGRGRLNTGEV